MVRVKQPISLSLHVIDLFFVNKKEISVHKDSIDKVHRRIFFKIN